MYEFRGLAFLSLLAFTSSSVIPVKVARDSEIGINIQSFENSLGGFAAPAVIFHDSAAEGPYSVGQSTYKTAASALSSSCAQQYKNCASGLKDGSTCATVADCDTQQTDCEAAATTIAAQYDTTRELKRDGGKFKLPVSRAVTPGVKFEDTKRDGGKFKLPSRAVIPGATFEESPEKRDGGKFKLSSRAVNPGAKFEDTTEKRDGGKFKLPAVPRAVTPGVKFEDTTLGRRDGGKFRGPVV